MEKVEINNNSFDIIRDYKNGYKKDDFVNKYTDYFDSFDYIVGDWAYGKLRLKGFYNNSNPKCKEMNDYNNLDKYLKENCAFECAYFVAKRN